MQKTGSMKKEQFMLKVYDKVSDNSYNKMIKAVKMVTLSSAYHIIIIVI